MSILILTPSPLDLSLAIVRIHSIAGTIFANSLVTQLAKYAPDLPPTVAQQVRDSVTYIFTLPPDEQVQVVAAYSKAVAYVFLLGIPCGILASGSAL